MRKQSEKWPRGEMMMADDKPSVTYKPMTEAEAMQRITKLATRIGDAERSEEELDTLARLKDQRRIRQQYQAHLDRTSGCIESNAAAMPKAD